MALYTADYNLLRKLSVVSNDTLSVSDRGSTTAPSLISESSCLSQVCKVHSGYMIMYKVSSNLLRQWRRKPIWVSLTQGKKLVLSKRGTNGKYKGTPKIFDLSDYNKCEFVGESQELITIYNTNRYRSIDSILLVAPGVEEAQEWVDLINYNIGVECPEDSVRNATDDAEGVRIPDIRVAVCF
ncbi:hypothetical protein SARC_01918 [Sphaeroforma arctica JP610]|uniref:PH domain-containing protein n=1 Tax=Sphaeroforma arctica JP610 TaxID=667725 RepID=A0A0L0GAK8_9EUKA|nr:hypothetical protein SARC_01918 [Sphaeroforma arctica JP610]KNC85926.1 hypothetical protein SARC_01918 [Sphaeroforma arctica JP610]|eukprot:XP_014159828.1 hypothetical protein SARC_01918 [Sphaeroforma arctica JP610]